VQSDPVAEVKTPRRPDTDVRVAVIVPTYQRPDHLALTLRSLAAQEAAPRIAVVVVENHAEGGEGAAVANRMIAAGEIEGLAIVERRQGNCNAYNAGMFAALETFPAISHVAIIDDDEIAVPGWLAALLAIAETTGVDIVGGPHQPVFEDKAGGQRYGAHPVFHGATHASGAIDLVTGTGNCLISASVLRHMAPRFLDERFNFLGGGDTDFFTRCRAAGFRFGWAADAIVHETVPSRRTESAWLTSRSIRNGLISALVQRRHNPGLVGRLKVLAKSLALLLVSPLRSIALWRKTGSLYIGTYPVLVAVGRLLSEVGYTTEQYREPEKN
jgi:GT2 family glycosyltransferase